MPAVLGELKGAAPEETKAILSRVRAALRETELEQSVFDEVRCHHERLGASWVAVRSSATAEDLPEHSFAGQHETYFLPAAAIVMDLGGLLSHGSIVAREYGIPAVVNVGPATELIKTGQMIRVDGTAGTVTLV